MRRDVVGRRGLGLCVVWLALGCASAVPAPPPPDATRIAEVRVTPWEGVGEPHTVTERGRVERIAASRAFTALRWEETGRTGLQPTYRIELIARDGSARTYWLGTNASLGSFPCYRMCSGWWIAGSDGEGSLDPSRRAVMASAIWGPLLNDLGI